MWYTANLELSFYSVVTFAPDMKWDFTILLNEAIKSNDLDPLLGVWKDKKAKTFGKISNQSSEEQ